jgi:hypothetical protein
MMTAGAILVALGLSVFHFINKNGPAGRSSREQEAKAK